MNKLVIITGATGMIGRLVLKHSLASDEVEKVISLLRKPSGVEHSKLEEVIVADFTDLSSYRHLFEKIDVAYFCIGVYTGAVSRDAFREITVEMPVVFAHILKENSPEANLVLLSGAGADRSEKSSMMFARDKGIAENKLSELFPGQFYAVRPGYIYPVVKRKEPNFGYRIYRLLYPLIRALGDNNSIKSTELAAAIFKIGMHGAPQEVLENKDILNQLK